MNPKGIFFDLYGTLLLYGDMDAAWSDWLDSLYESLSNSGLRTSRESLADKCDGLLSRPEPALQDDELTLYERRIWQLCLDLNLNLSRGQIQNAAESSVGGWHGYISLDPEAIPVLRELSSRKILALISNFDHPPMVRSLLSDLGLNRFFQTVVVSGEVAVKKPDPSIFYGALEKTQLHPNQVVYVGDSEKEDVQGALAAGIHPVLIQRNRSGQDRVSLDFKSQKGSTEGLSEIISATDGRQIISKLSSLIELFC